MKFIKFYKRFASGAKVLENLALLALRLVLAYGFYIPATKKFGDLKAVGDWFETLGIPFAQTSAYLVATFEMLGVLLLTFGLFTRFICIPLMITMLVAIFTVHWSNGFAVGDNGYEIPLYYLAMLGVLLAKGPGKLSFDGFIFEK